MPRRPIFYTLLSATALLMTACGGNPPPRAYAPVSPEAATLDGNQENEPIQTAAIPRTPPPAVAAQSAIVIDYASGRVLYAKNADTPRAVASTQKLMTALCVLDAGLNSNVTVEASDGACEPTKLDIKAGETYTRAELLKVLMVKSANDVGRALARDVGGSQDGFAAMMNAKAAQLGMRNSHFCNPHGLTEPGQFSTARDMAIAARTAFRSPVLRQYTSTRSYVFRYANGRVREVENTNKLLKRVPYCNGLKTGTTDAAGRCLVCSGTLNGRTAIVVVLKSNTPNVWKDSEKLLRWALERPSASM